MDLSRWIDRHAAFTPDKAALVCSERSWSYAELAQGVAATAAGLAAQGVTAGERVAHLGLNSAEQLLLLFACARLGALFAPLSWRLAAPEHRAMLVDCTPRVLVLDPAFVDASTSLGDVLGQTCCVCIGAARPGWMSFQSLLDAGAPPPEAQYAAGPDDAVLLCYTSGSTGEPKGVVLTQEALFYNAVNSAHMHDMTSADVVLTSLPLFHVGGLNIQTLPALRCGASVILHPRFEPAAVSRALQTQGVTLTVLVPAQLDLLERDASWASLSFPALRSITTGSSIIDQALYRKHRRADVPLLQVYGATETCPIAAYQRAADAPAHPGSAGLAALHCELRLVDESGGDVPAGATGEIWIRGPNVMQAYWAKPAESAAALRDGWYHSGDVGHQDAQGFLYVDGRSKDVIISGGENIYPAELENLLSLCEDIAEVAVVGRPDVRWGEAVVAVVVPKAGQQITRERITQVLEGRVARFKLPREVVLLPSLPRTALGKLMREQIRAAVRNASVAATA
ncbi:MAG: AMP-binding protein [Betaproteobacteria bacterium]